MTREELAAVRLEIGMLIEVEGQEYVLQGFTTVRNDEGRSIQFTGQDPQLHLRLMAQKDTQRLAAAVQASAAPLIDEMRKELRDGEGWKDRGHDG